MSRSRRGFAPYGRLAIAAAVIGLVPAVTACEAGNNAPVTQFHPQSVGVNTIVHGIYIRDAFILGWQAGSSVPTGQSAGLFLALINEGSPDRLVSITAPGTAASVALPHGGISLGGQQAVYLVGPEPKIVLHRLLHPLVNGKSVRVRLDFLNVGSVTLSLPVLPRSDIYATFSPAPLPSPSGSASPSGSRKPHAANTMIPATPSASSTP